MAIIPDTTKGKPKKPQVGDQYQADSTLSPGPLVNGVVNTAQLQNWFRSWATSTESCRSKFRRDFEYAEGNGKQWSQEDRAMVRKTNRPVLEFNQILPQVEYICGMQRDMEVDFKLYPRGYEDVRISEIATSVLKASMDFGRVHRTSDRVFDDAMICGLGVWEVLHSLDDADDLLWGDILVNRINPMAYIYDPWSIKMDCQDGAFMGKAVWMDIAEFRNKYPKFSNMAVPGEWLSRVNQLIGASDDLGTGPNLIPELWDQATGRIRVLTMWYKVPTNIVLLVDERSGECKEFNTTDEAEKFKADVALSTGQQASSPLSIQSQGTTATIAGADGMPVIDPQIGGPPSFASPEMAQAHLNMMSEQAGLAATMNLQVIKRVAKKPQWAEMVYWQVLDEGKSPFKDRNYPFVPYISRRWADDPESIFGMVRNLWDPQDEYNKRYSNLLAHVNSSSHSGWLNRKSGGSNTKELELMGSKPGVVVEYASQAPVQIHPVEMSQGHFAMLQASERNILKISGINAEMVGQTTQQTVSGRAIKARQSGGAIGLKPRFRTFEESQLDLARMLFSRIQQYYPPEKIRRIIGVSEMSMPMGPGGTPMFCDPITGMPMPEDGVLQWLQKMGEIEFDIVFGLQNQSETERQAQWEQTLQVAQLVAQSGRPIGPATFMAMIDASDMPSKMANALKMDAMAPPVQQADPGAQAQQIGKMQGGGQGQSKGGPMGDGASSGGGGSGPTAGKKSAAQERGNNK